MNLEVPAILFIQWILKRMFWSKIQVRTWMISQELESFSS